jgi:hypothetical protein
MVKYVDFIFSINVHEKPQFLLKQIENIKKNVTGTYRIILNTNKLMFDILHILDLDKNIKINSNYIEKRRFHGSLTQGIYSNMKIAIKHYNFSYFIVLSSRTFFFKGINLKLINKEKRIKQQNQNYNVWHWPVFFKTLIVLYYLEKSNINSVKLFRSAHEGMAFSYLGCISIINFLKNNITLRDNLFNFEGCVEEFALQTIVCNQSNEGFLDLGSGVEDNKQLEGKYLYKIIRE